MTDSEMLTFYESPKALVSNVGEGFEFGPTLRDRSFSWDLNASLDLDCEDTEETLQSNIDGDLLFLNSASSSSGKRHRKNDQQNKSKKARLSNKNVTIDENKIIDITNEYFIDSSPLRRKENSNIRYKDTSSPIYQKPTSNPNSLNSNTSSHHHHQNYVEFHLQGDVPIISELDLHFDDEEDNEDEEEDDERDTQDRDEQLNSSYYEKYRNEEVWENSVRKTSPPPININEKVRKSPVTEYISTYHSYKNKELNDVNYMKQNERKDYNRATCNSGIMYTTSTSLSDSRNSPSTLYMNEISIQNDHSRISDTHISMDEQDIHICQQRFIPSIPNHTYMSHSSHLYPPPPSTTTTANKYSISPTHNQESAPIHSNKLTENTTINATTSTITSTSNDMNHHELWYDDAHIIKLLEESLVHNKHKDLKYFENTSIPSYLISDITESNHLTSTCNSGNDYLLNLPSYRHYSSEGNNSNIHLYPGIMNPSHIHGNPISYPPFRSHLADITDDSGKRSPNNSTTTTTTSSCSNNMTSINNSRYGHIHAPVQPIEKDRRMMESLTKIEKTIPKHEKMGTSLNMYPMSTLDHIKSIDSHNLTSSIHNHPVTGTKVSMTDEIIKRHFYTPSIDYYLTQQQHGATSSSSLLATSSSSLPICISSSLNTGSNPHIYTDINIRRSSPPPPPLSSVPLSSSTTNMNINYTDENKVYKSLDCESLSRLHGPTEVMKLEHNMISYPSIHTKQLSINSNSTIKPQLPFLYEPTSSSSSLLSSPYYNTYSPPPPHLTHPYSNITTTHPSYDIYSQLKYPLYHNNSMNTTPFDSPHFHNLKPNNVAPNNLNPASNSYFPYPLPHMDNYTMYPYMYPSSYTSLTHPYNHNNTKLSQIKVGKYTIEERQIKIAAFRAKKQSRIWCKQIKYDCRKRLADTRPRVKGRFVSRNENGDEEVLIESSRGGGGGGGVDRIDIQIDDQNNRIENRSMSTTSGGTTHVDSTMNECQSTDTPNTPISVEMLTKNTLEINAMFHKTSCPVHHINDGNVRVTYSQDTVRTHVGCTYPTVERNDEQITDSDSEIHDSHSSLTESDTK